MGKWKSTQHPISDMRDWKKRRELEIQPDFLRRSVWSGKREVYIVLVKALQQNPKNRYKDALIFRDDLIEAIEAA